MAQLFAKRSMITRQMSGPFKFAAYLIAPAAVIGMMAAPIAKTETPAVAPLACTTSWTMVGHTIIFVPDCKRDKAPGPTADPSQQPAPPPGN